MEIEVTVDTAEGSYIDELVVMVLCFLDWCRRILRGKASWDSHRRHYRDCDCQDELSVLHVVLLAILATSKWRFPRAESLMRNSREVTGRNEGV